MSNWRQSETEPRVVLDANRASVAICDSADHAAQIVREHNSHAALLDACKGMRDWMAHTGLVMDGTDADRAIALAEAKP